MEKGERRKETNQKSIYAMDKAFVVVALCLAPSISLARRPHLFLHPAR